MVKGFSSQVCDYDGKILFVNAAHGGRTHDARVWNTSALSVHLKERFLNGETSAWLLGDSAYPILPYLMTPKLNQEPGTPSARYTQAHVSARSRIERCIGELKGRWRSAKRTSTTLPTRVCGFNSECSLYIA
ncbi:PREDICTED: putative nuclease HARBI1 [Cyphomyrmex costatus]|uniref:putative nuclease HARBI1 n=1 Tax=Cyphomyrmex costatus TaxID=456900 RepID=UPI00085233D0|nr:PREDICTED: putative nuclease HARBI1 [Cyphomyrmex costatus]